MSRQFIKEHPGEWVCRDGIRATGCLGDKLWGIRNRGRGSRIRALPPHRIGKAFARKRLPAPHRTPAKLRICPPIFPLSALRFSH